MAIAVFMKTFTGILVPAGVYLDSEEHVIKEIFKYRDLVLTSTSFGLKSYLNKTCKMTEDRLRFSTMVDVMDLDYAQSTPFSICVMDMEYK